MKRKVIYAVAIIVAIVATSAAFLANSAQPSDRSAYDNVLVSQTVMERLSSISSNASLANTVGIGTASTFLRGVSAPALIASDGKPEVLYIGAEFCPFCSISRWGLIIALTRFGSFSGLRYMTSSTSDAFPGTVTFSFYKTAYQSQFVNFTGVEEATNKKNATSDRYDPLQSLTALEAGILQKYNPQGSVPFMDFGNRSISIGALASPGALKDLNWSTVVGELDNPSTAVAQGIIGSANVYTAQICAIINNSAPVCSQAYVKSIQSQQ